MFNQIQGEEQSSNNTNCYKPRITTLLNLFNEFPGFDAACVLTLHLFEEPREHNNAIWNSLLR